MKWFSAIPRALTGGWGTTALLFLVVLSVLLHGVFLPDQTLFSNDGPLGELMAQCHSLPGRFAGCWADLNNIGFNAGAAMPGISSGLQWLLGPVWFSKFYAVLSLWMLGLAAWLFFRQSGLSPLACVLGGGAMMLNSTFFSTACWGMSPHVITAAMFLLALAALMHNSDSSRRLWLRLVLAGLAVGMGVAEGADVGAIFSLYVAVFMLYQAWTAEGSRTMKLVKGISRLVLVVLCAVFLAAQPINALVATSIKGVVGTGQDAQTKAQKWGWATQWSLPKLETLGLVVPGLFGYRIDTPDGGTYWGMIGRDPAWEKYLADESQGPPPTGFLRYVGSGYYTGVLVVLVAFWAVAQSLRRKNSHFNIEHRKWLWFWLGVAVFSLLLALGRFAPFYRWFYALPYASTIRNPDKFLYLFSLAVVVLFAFGVDGLWRKYMQPAGTNSDFRWAGLQSWWNRAAKFDKYWVYGCGLVVVASLLAWLDYSQHRQELDRYLLSVHFNSSDADSIASFSIHQVGWFILLFSLASGLLVLIFSGAFAGRRAGRGVILLGLLLLADLGLANRPWIIYWNYKEKYASNPVIDLLRDKPYEHRVTLASVNLPPELMTISDLYKNEWLQQQFPFYNIQSFDVVEMSRLPEDMSALMKVLNQTNVTDPAFLWSRVWQLTNTRYILGPADFWNLWNQQGYLARTPLQTVVGFDIVPKPGLSEAAELDQLIAVPDTDGPFALFEFKAALPRAKLYDRWQINTNNSVVLNQLFSPGFNLESSVFVAGGVPTNSATIGTNQTVGEVQFTSYAPKDIILKAEASSPSVLLLNDHYDPNWKVLVDGEPKRLLRCNSLMRGVYLLPGTHIVEFKFQPPIGLAYVSLAAIAIGLLAIGILVVSVNKDRLVASKLASPPPPTAAPASANQSTGKPHIRKKAG